MIDLEKLRSFFYLIKEGSYAKASLTMKRSRLTLVNHIAEIEKVCGSKVFVKSRKRFVLTEKGADIFRLAQDFIPNLDNGLSEILTSKQPPKPNRLRILTTTGTISVFLIRKIKKLLEDFPNLDISIITQNNNLDFEDTKADVGILQKINSSSLSQKKSKQ